MKKLLIVVGTRPNFIKITQFKKVNEQTGNYFDIKLLHTGQHYDDKMADVFFRQFGLQPDFFLNISASSANTQMAEIMLRLEKVCLNEFMPDLIIVVGDVNSTFAAALTANKMGIKIAHVESGLRSFDRTMPEEYNRMLTDVIADYLFVTEESGHKHLLKEGRNEGDIFIVGNTMIDTLVAFDPQIQLNDILLRYDLRPQEFVMMTMHRPATVDFKEGLEKLLAIIEHITANYRLVFPVHPRTLHRMEQFGMLNAITDNKNLIVTEPLDYFSFQKLVSDCCFVITDSGGIQEETTFRQVPCLTLRKNTERPSTVEIGSNELLPFDLENVSKRIQAISNGTYKKGAVPTLWDGNATFRILETLKKLL